MPDDFDSTTVTWVWDKDSLAHLKEAIWTCEEVVIDLETSGGNEYETGKRKEWPVRAQIVLASLTLPQANDTDGVPSTWVVPLSHPDSPFLGRWKRVMTFIAANIKAAEKPVINQNMKFDSRWIFAHTGVDLSHQIAWDTQSGSHLLDETETTKLKDRASRVFGIDNWKDNDLTTPGAALKVPLFDLGIYAAHDTYYAWRLAVYQRRLMNLTDPEEPEGPEEVELARLGRLAIWCSMPMVATLTAVEQRGMHLDTDWTREHLAENRLSVTRLTEELAARYADDGMMTSEPSFAPTSKWFMAWAEAACEAGDLRVTALTDTGRPQWNKAVLLRQARGGSQVAQDLLDLRGHTKRAEYLASWLTLVSPSGFIHPSYYLARVVTGRLSCSDPNVQQITAALKPAFIPSRRGRVVIDLDYSQVEMRGAAFISRCEPMLQAFREGRDLHAMLALKILQLGEEHAARAERRSPRIILPEEVTPTHRQAGKSANFGLLFTMGPGGFQTYAETAYGLSFTMEESTLIHDAFYEMWTGIGAWHAKAISRARATGQVSSPIGRVRRLPDIHDGNGYLVGRAERAAVNAPVQGFASDMMQIAAASIEGTLPGVAPVRGAYLIGTIHDSILIEAAEDDWERVARECIDRMLNVGGVLKRMGCELDVPLAVEGKCGSRWGFDDIGKVHG